MRDRENGGIEWRLNISPIAFWGSIIAFILVIFTALLLLMAYTSLLDILPGYRTKAEQLNDQLTESMEKAMNETNRRRALQQAYNEMHGITPQSVKSTVQALIRITDSMAAGAPDTMSEEELAALMKSVEDQMLSAAKELDFEKAAKLRDQLFQLKGEKQDIQKPQQRRHRKKKF